MSLKIGGKFFRRTDVKLTLLYILTFSISAFLICAFLYVRFRHQLIKEVDRFLLDEADELTEVLFHPSRDLEIMANFENQIKMRTNYPVFFRILKEDGTPFFISENFRKNEFRIDAKVLSNSRNHKETKEYIYPAGMERPLRLVSVPLYQDRELVYIVQLGTHLKYVRKNLIQFRRNIYFSFPIMLLLSSLGGWLLARRSLSPIIYITSKANRITSNNLSERLTPRGIDDEMDDLIRTINGMISRLESSFKRVSEFTADTSHELKTPICALRGEAEVLLSKERKADEYKEGLAHFIERFDQLNRMINDLIFLSKTDSSQVELNMDPLRVDLLIKDISDLFQVLAEQKNISLNIDPCQETTVMGDKIRLQQLFTNLIDNALKFTPEKGSIQIRVEKNMDFAQVKVIDTGIGIPIEEQKNIFKRFYRVDKSRSKETGGVGLGLSIAEWIAHAHHGRIEVESELNKGSTFKVYLPLQKMPFKSE